MLGRSLKKQMANSAAAIRQAFRGVINRTNSSTATQMSQVDGLADETVNDMEIMQHFGFTSNPPAGTDCVVIPLGGKTSHAVVVASENGEYRIKGLPSGAVAVYDQSGSKIILKNDGTIDVFASKTTYHGDIHATGQITSEGDQIAGGVSQINHTHGGIKSGNSSTKKPN
ncbi:MAG: phage baseplate assembly protein [Gammaproteobacteria bacterium]|nr:phage baseplate assembly protein [Gammaproteobacteria bacterium]